MRNLMIGAAMAALAIGATPALAQSGQNIDIESNQRNNGTVVGSVIIQPVTVGGVLTARSLAVGNVMETTALNAQGISDIATGGSTQDNRGSVTSNLTASRVTSGNAVLASTAAGNLINQTAILVTNGGNQTLGQVNSGDIAANATVQQNITNGSSLNVASTAIGNSMSADATNLIALGNSGGFTQVNTGRVNANTNFVFGGDSGGLDATSAAIGNTASAIAPTVGVELTQTNSGAQTAVTTALQGAQRYAVSSTALGNVVGLTGNATGNLSQTNSANQNATTTSVVTAFNGGAGTAGSTAIGNVVNFDAGTAGSLTNLTQVNTGAQTATTDFNTPTTTGFATGSATAVGSVLQVTSGQSFSANGSQFNSGTQNAVLNVNGNFSGGSSFGSTGVGNLIDANVGGFSTQLPQTNVGNVSANTNLTGGTFGALTAVSAFGAGNALQVQTTALGGPGSATIGGGAGQLNSGNISTVANVSAGSFGALNVSATSIGNLASVKTGN